jgi:hypothetical protein
MDAMDMSAEPRSAKSLEKDIFNLLAQVEYGAFKMSVRVVAQRVFSERI